MYITSYDRSAYYILGLVHIMSPKPLVSLIRLGRTKYLPALKLQHYLVEKVKASRQKVTTSELNTHNNDNIFGNSLNYLLILEHEPVYTTGIRNRNQYLKEAEKSNLSALGADFVQTDRGGLITFHGPGQLVAYPILNLENFIPENSSLPANNKKTNVIGTRWYVNTLEQSVIDLLKSNFGLKSHRSVHTGVWLGEEDEGSERKICAMGLRNSQLVTSHGLALNCNIDLNWFNHIVPCGIEGKGVTSITKEINLEGSGNETTVESVIPYYVDAFQRSFQCDVRDHDNSEFIEYLSSVS